MDGSISVESTPGVGSCFKVNLPFAIVETAAPEKTLPKATISWAGPPLRILLAEDNQVNTTFGTLLLKKLGFNVVSVANGLECLVALNNETFDIVLMDIQMPIMNGEEALAGIRSIEKGTARHLPVIALTAYALRGEKERFLRAGFDGYVSKPIDINDLICEMTRVTGTCGSGGMPEEADEYE
jgi:CheY-like chemotaxis protein